ncbi:GIY-YIG nuclease family protein [Halothermothrix orenii]|uniref:Excinuclease ABC C subunit domain protein n=1 Tax=Halothermothrix orenii (strain H 168 / OCM 544 / DSM 9562) TaxID=373903 RepID=B8D1S6_HALOH|nr:GIY-YIG nuclease family protein [Halothermothrix orenii]ACL69153.1 Excinuclease ABC C subunit domain protein [Halothermothrix orenii H 168]
MHYVYIVECSDGSFYTGYTTDVERRVKEHNRGIGAKYTRGRRPVKLRYQECYSTKSEAMRREYELKQLTRFRKEELINKKVTRTDK